MSMTGGSSSSQTTSTQPYIIQGPTLAAANSAANAQITASEQASQAASLQDNAALSTIMGEYGTALQYAQPAINTGNQAAAQENYMLGLNAVNPGAAPTAPTINQADIQQYLENNYADPITTSTNGGSSSHPEYTGYVPSNVSITPQTAAQLAAGNQVTDGPNVSGNGDLYSVGALPDGATAQSGNGATQYVNSLNPGIYTNIGQTANQNPINALSSNPEIDQWATQAIQNDPTQSSSYNAALTSYNQEMQAYQNQDQLYNQYASKGQATGSDISDIVQNLPGFQFQQQQGVNQIQNAASASGMLNSGSLLQQLDQFGQQLSSTYYNNYLSQLGGLASSGNAAAAQVGGEANTVGQSAGAILNSLGTTQANSALSSGQAMASSYLSPAINQSITMTPYTTTSSTSGSSDSSSLTGSGLLSGLSGIGSMLPSAGGL